MSYANDFDINIARKGLANEIARQLGLDDAMPLVWAIEALIEAIARSEAAKQGENA